MTLKIIDRKKNLRGRSKIMENSESDLRGEDSRGLVVYNFRRRFFGKIAERFAVALQQQKWRQSA